MMMMMMRSFGFLVIKVCNHGEHYETPCTYACMDISVMPLTRTSGVTHRKLQYYYVYNDVTLLNLIQQWFF